MNVKSLIAICLISIFASVETCSAKASKKNKVVTEEAQNATDQLEYSGNMTESQTTPVHLKRAQEAKKKLSQLKEVLRENSLDDVVMVLQGKECSTSLTFNAIDAIKSLAVGNPIQIIKNGIYEVSADNTPRGTCALHESWFIAIDNELKKSRTGKVCITHTESVPVSESQKAPSRTFIAWDARALKPQDEGSVAQPIVAFVELTA